MYYDGDAFCAQDANELNRWTYVDFAQGGFVNDGQVAVTCAN